MNPDAVGADHRARLACVYVRQSSPHQVNHHLESQRRQRQLIDRPHHLGWAPERVVVLDEDLGRSADRGTVRMGFTDMVAQTATGQVGLIVALEVSRLARSNQDWYHLLDICAVRGTLLADRTGLYDPRDYNDRLLLGLWGTMSETELHVMKQRLVEAMRAKARRGEFRFRTPPGYVWDEAGNLVKRPDRQVQTIIELVFQRFAELGSAHSMHRSLLDDEVLVPVLARRGQTIRWKLPTYGYVLRVLKNPLYAGAYIWGQREVIEELDDNNHPIKRTRRRKPERWPVLIPDHHEAYISWETFEQNQRRLAANMRSSGGPGPAREGASLLQGLVLCGSCGRRMRVKYKRAGTTTWMRYECNGDWRAVTRAKCQGVGAGQLERAVEELVLEALAPLGMEAMLQALARDASCRASERAHWDQRVERARYEVELARRQYDAVDPANRLVAVELEARWEHALRGLAEVEAAARHKLEALEQPLTTLERQRLLEHAEGLEELWRAPTTRPQGRKRILRCLIEHVVVSSTGEAIIGQVHWVDGKQSEVRVQRRKRGQHSCVTDEDLVELVRKLASELSDSQIARVLVRRGLRTARGLPFTRSRVANLRHGHDIPVGPPPPRLVDAHVHTAAQAAELLGVSHGTVIRWVEAGVLKGAQLTFGAPWRVRVTPDDISRLKPGAAPDGWVTLKKAAAALGVSQQTILQRLDGGQLEGARVQSGRRVSWKIRLPSVCCDAQASLFD